MVWPYYITAKITKDMESLSPCKKKLISSVANMVWWLIGTIATYLIYEALSTHHVEESHYPETKPVEESQQIYERMRRELSTDLERYTTQNAG